MSKFFWAIRIGLALLLSVAAMLVWRNIHEPETVQPHKAYVNKTLSAYSNLKMTLSTINSLPLNTLENGVPGVVADRADLFENVSAKINTDFPPAPLPLSHPVNPKQVTFNRIISNPDFKKVVSQSRAATFNAKAYVNHRAGTLNALTNILQYQPDVDVSTNDKNMLKQTLEAAVTGLNKTKSRLADVPAYENDKSLDYVVEQVNQAEIAVKQLLTQIDGPDLETNKSIYINAVMTIQQSIIKNRTEFRNNENNTIINDLSEVIDKFKPFIAALKETL